VASRQLDLELDRLARRVHAAAVVVVDEKTPVRWGTSEGAAAHEDLVERAIARVRSGGARRPRMVRAPEPGVFARPFADLYWLVLVFDAACAELPTRAAVRRALPAIERLVIALPPIDPPPQRGQLLRMPIRLVRR
jgi:hypothetical protein